MLLLPHIANKSTYLVLLLYVYNLQSNDWLTYKRFY